MRDQALVPRWYAGVDQPLPRIKRNHFPSRPLAKDPFLATKEELQPFGNWTSALVFPLGRTGPGEGFIIQPEPPVFDLKDPPWLACWESFYEEYKHHQKQPWPRFKPDLEGILSQSPRIASFSRQLLLRIPLADMVESMLCRPGAPGLTTQKELQDSFLSLVGSKGAVGTTDSEILLLFPLPEGIDPELYTSQCRDFIGKTFGTVEPPEVYAAVSRTAFTPGEWGQ